MVAMLVPVGVAYAQASGLPGITGLYATIIPLLAYAVFGPSRILILGPDSALAAVIFGVVSPFSDSDPQRAIRIAAMMALVSGGLCVAAGLARLGFVTELLSKPIRYGYMNGIALTLVLSQIPKLCGFSLNTNGPLRQVWGISRNLLAGKANIVTAAIGLSTLVLILLLKRWIRVPGILMSVVLSILVVAGFNLSERFGVSVLGALPQGLPLPKLPLVSMSDLESIVIGGAAIALVSFADTSMLSRAYAARLRAQVDPNQELVGLGIANIAAGFFQGFPISCSSSRTPVAESAGAKTQLTAVVSAVIIALLLEFAPQLLRYLPNTALAAVVIASAIGLFEISDLHRIYRIQRWEFWLSVVCFAGVAIFGAIQGIAIAVVIAIIEFLWDGWRPHWAVLGSVDGVNGFHDITRYPEARLIPGLVLFRWDAPLFFANAELFNQTVLAVIENSTTAVKRMVITASPVTGVDVTAADALSELHKRLREVGIKLCFAEMKDPVKDELKRFGIFKEIGEPNFFGTIDEAVSSYCTE